MNDALPLKRVRLTTREEDERSAADELRASIRAFLDRKMRTHAFRNRADVLVRMSTAIDALFDTITFIEGNWVGPINDNFGRYLRDSRLDEATAANAALIKEREDLKEKLAAAEKTILAISTESAAKDAALRRVRDDVRVLEEQKRVADRAALVNHRPPENINTINSRTTCVNEVTYIPVVSSLQRQQQQCQLPVYSHAYTPVPTRPPPLPPSPQPLPQTPTSTAAADDVLTRLQRASYFTIDANNSFQLQDTALKAMYRDVSESLDCIRKRLGEHRVAFDDLRTIVQFYDTLETSQPDGTVDDDASVELASTIWAKRCVLEYCFKNVLSHMNEACKAFSRAPPYRPYNARLTDMRFVSVLKLTIDLIYSGVGKHHVSTADPLRVKLTRMCNTPVLLLCLVEFGLSKIVYRIETLTRLYALIQYVDK